MLDFRDRAVAQCLIGCQDLEISFQQIGPFQGSQPETDALSARRYLTFLKETLTPKRFEHSLGVAQVMGELAQVYALDQERAVVTGLLHDAAKDLGPPQQAEIISQANIEICYECELNYSLYLHGPVSAYVV